MIFGAPLFLWGLLALAIPIAVHLFQFRRYRKVYFSNVDRLESLQTESRRQSNLRRWLVLLMRCLAIVFLVLAFAPAAGRNYAPAPPSSASTSTTPSPWRTAPATARSSKPPNRRPVKSPPPTAPATATSSSPTPCPATNTAG